MVQVNGVIRKSGRTHETVFSKKHVFVYQKKINKESFTVGERILCLQEKIESYTPPSLENNAFKSQDSFWVT